MERVAVHAPPVQTLELEAITRLSPDIVVYHDSANLTSILCQRTNVRTGFHSKSTILRSTLTDEGDVRAYLCPTNYFIAETPRLLLNGFGSYLTDMCSDSFERSTRRRALSALAGGYNDVSQAYRESVWVAPREAIAWAGANMEA